MTDKYSRQTFSEWLALTEAGKNAAKVKWIKKQDEWKGNFVINNIEYNIHAYTDEIVPDFEVWEFKFYKDNKTTKITGDFAAHFILVPTIKNAFEEFVKEKQPDAVLFLAADSSKSRKSLYKQTSDYIGTKYKYISINPMLGDNDTLFGVCKEDYMVDTVKKLIKRSYI